MEMLSINSQHKKVKYNQSEISVFDRVTSYPYDREKY